MFRKFNEVKSKTELIKYLENILSSMHVFSNETVGKVSCSLISSVWQDYYNLVSGSVFKEPNKFSVSFLAVVNSLKYTTSAAELIKVDYCVLKMKNEISSNYALFDFNEVDERIIEQAFLIHDDSKERIEFAKTEYQKRLDSIERIKNETEMKYQAERQELISKENDRKAELQKKVNVIISSNKKSDWFACQDLFTGEKGFSKNFSNCIICNNKTGQTIGGNFVCSRCLSKFEIVTA